MKVYSLKPFIVTRSILFVYMLFSNIRFDSESDIFMIGKPPSWLEDSFDKSSCPCFLKSIEWTNSGEEEDQLFQMFGAEGFEDNDQIFEGLENLPIHLDRNRLTELSPQLATIFKNSEMISISDNKLEHLDTSMLASCTNLLELYMLKSCSPDAKFTLDFLATLTQLTYLFITLPEGPADFSVFANLSSLLYLGLEGVPSIDASKKRTELNQESFLQLSQLSELNTLKLSFFDIASLGKDFLIGFNQLTDLSLAHNLINSIHADAIKNCPSNLTDLDLACNQLTHLLSDLFGNQVCLVNLDLRKNSLHTLDCDCFRDLENLNRLKLQKNRIEDLPLGVFKSLGNLLELYLSGNRIKTIKPGVFDKMPNLMELNLDENPISTIHQDSFQNLAGLTKLSINRCQLKSINNRMFTGLIKLQELNLNDNLISSFEIVDEFNTILLDKANLSPMELEAVRKHLFEDLKNLTTLSLNGNRLEKLDLNVFLNLEKLKELNLSSNAISELNDISLEQNLTSLTTLKLQHNQLVAISKNAFSSAKKLRHLDLSRNKLKKLDDGFFVPYEDLHYLSLKSNNLTFNINRHTFSRGGRNVRKICLDENQMVRIEDGAFENTKYLCSLEIDLPTSFLISNQRQGMCPNQLYQSCVSIRKSTSEVLKLFFLNEMNFSGTHQSLGALCIKNSCLESLDEFHLDTKFRKLFTLDLSGNQLQELKSWWFEGLHRLRYLNVCNNLLEELVDPELFNHFRFLITINLSNNKLKRLNRNLFNGLVRLKSIDLSVNPQLSNIDPTLFRELHCLTIINLSGNNIQSLNMYEMIQFCPSLTDLDLSSNQLDHRSINRTSMRRGDQLIGLNLARNRLENMEFVFNLYNLEQLDLSGNQISSLLVDGFNTLGRLMKLENLNLSCNQIESFDVKVILHLRPKLLHLDLSQNPFDLKEPDVLKRIKWLPRSK